MKRILGSALLLALLALNAGLGQEPSGAPDQPRLLPTRDVDVSYQMLPGGTPLKQRMRWRAGTRTLRLDPPLADLFVIVEYDQKRMSVVREAERIVLDTTVPAHFMSSIETRLSNVVRRGQDRIAGLSCTRWETTDLQNNPAEACITPDGVLLQVRSHGHVQLTAAAVSYAPQDPTLFRIPDGYRHLSTGNLSRLPTR
jgi:hypothetical protein